MIQDRILRGVFCVGTGFFFGTAVGFALYHGVPPLITLVVLVGISFCLMALRRKS